MKEIEERTCKICGMKFKTKDGRVKTCHRHKSRYNSGMAKKTTEPKTITEVMLNEHKKAKIDRIIMFANFALNVIIAFGVTCNLILNIVK